MNLPRAVSEEVTLQPIEPAMGEIVRVLNMSRELSCTQKRVYFADVVETWGPAGNTTSAAMLAVRVGLSGEQVEYARRSLVEDRLQEVIARPSGRVVGRRCVFPKELDPGAGADEARCLAAAIMLDGWIIKNRRLAGQQLTNAGSMSGPHINNALKVTR